MRRPPASAAAAFAAILLGCANAAPPSPKSTVLAGTSANVIVLLPLNVTAAMPRDLKAASPAIFEELSDYLQAQGARLKTVAYPSARQLWLASIREARTGKEGARAGFDEAAHIFVGKLASYADFDTVIVPSLFLQGAAVSGRTATWDGVERALDIEPGRWKDALPDEIQLVGLAPAASLHAVILDARGNKVQEAQGGLALLDGIRVLGPPDSVLGGQNYELVPRPDPFASRSDVREGIALALAPFLPPPVSPAGGGAEPEP